MLQTFYNTLANKVFCFFLSSQSRFLGYLLVAIQLEIASTAALMPMVTVAISIDRLNVIPRGFHTHG